MFVQIVIFKLKPEASRELFTQLTRQMIAWLKIREGFVAYELYEGAECWSDRLVWSNKSYAEEGLKDFLLTDVSRKILSLVDDDYNSFMGQEVIAS